MKIIKVKKCDECRNRVLIAETNWSKGIAIEKSENQCSQVIGGKYGKVIETFPDIPKWCPLEDYVEKFEPAYLKE